MFVRILFECSENKFSDACCDADQKVSGVGGVRVSIEFPAKKKDAEEISDFFLPYLSNSLYTGQLERILLLGKHSKFSLICLILFIRVN